ncbi:MAG: ergothioneine biosynthesis protein EgtB [Novosphingobium sp.]|nr:ergothioneine biosynthesis protein EgtB [Novosphingobium sp.]
MARPLAQAADHAAATRRYCDVRDQTMALAQPLSPEDCQIQSMPDASPVKWHLAHTTWFFETFLLQPLLPDYDAFHPAFSVLFNSYYVGVGQRHPRAERGLLTRPSLDEVIAYRHHVDGAMQRLMARVAPSAWADLVELGCQHEQQHQELILMDIQHALSCNPLQPAYASARVRHEARPARWIDVPGGLYEIGHEGPGFHFDNEAPRHRVWLEPFRIAEHLVTAGDYATFIEDGGYDRPELWLSEGWDAAAREGWRAPLYWAKDNGTWTRFSLAGRSEVDAAEPVLHVSYYEADAFARWAQARLPTEAEWEISASHASLSQVDDQAWQWTGSAYLPYPGYVAPPGAVGEYNGKFMINQMVLRGGSMATPAGHARPSYRNFFPASARWPFSGIRLARS